MSRTSRRQFAKTLTLLPLAATELVAQTPPEKPLPRALAEVVKVQYRDHLGDDELQRVTATLQDQAALLERLRQFPLANSDEPDVTFSSLTKRWSK